MKVFLKQTETSISRPVIVGCVLVAFNAFPGLIKKCIFELVKPGDALAALPTILWPSDM